MIKGDIYHFMSGKHPHDSSRFDVYTELPDGSGFTIKGCSFIFKFDRYGGWFDEHGNYYNSDGQPDQPHSDSDEYQSEGSHSYHSQDDEEEDQYQKQFGGPKNYVEDQEQIDDIYLTKIARNIQLLNNYPSGQPFRVNFKNLPYISKRSQVFSHFQNKLPGILNVIFLQNQRRQFNGNGYFVVEDVKTGQSLVRLQGEKYIGREISFHLDDVQEFLLDPITNEELYPDFLNKKHAKSYVSKGNYPKIEEKQEIKKQTTEKAEKKQVEPAVKVESPSKNQVKPAQNQQELASYIFQRAAFPKKSSFNEWIQANHFSHQNDIKEVNKIESDLTKAKVTMKKKVFNALNGKKCNQVVVWFIPA